MKKFFFLFFFVFGVLFSLSAESYTTSISYQKNNAETLILMATYDDIEVYSIIENESFFIWYAENGILVYSGFSCGCESRNVISLDNVLLMSLDRCLDDFYSLSITTVTDTDVIMKRIGFEELPAYITLY